MARARTREDLNTGSRDVIGVLLGLVDQAYDHRSWHGTNLRGSIRGLSAAQAARRPARGRHNIWEIVVHCAYWKYAVWRRLTGAKRGTFPLRGSNWFARNGDGGAAAWRADVALLGEMHSQLRDTIAALDAPSLHKRRSGSPFDNAALVTGIAAHDLYHAGQIQLLKRVVR